MNTAAQPEIHFDWINEAEKKAGETVEIAQDQKNGRRIAPSRSPLKDLSVYGEVSDLTAVSDGYGKSDARLQRFFFGLELRTDTNNIEAKIVSIELFMK